MKGKRGSVVVDVLVSRAKELDAREVVSVRFDAVTAKAVVTAGLSLLGKHEAELRRRCPALSLQELRLAPEACERVIAAQRALAEHKATQTTELPALIEAALVWRRRLMPMAELLVAAGAIRVEVVDAIRVGTGSNDLVRDVLDLVRVLTPHRDALPKQYGSDALEVARQTAKTALAAMAKPVEDSVETAEQRDLRDRYATLVERFHDDMRVGAAVLFGYKRASEAIGSLRPQQKTEPAVDQAEPANDSTTVPPAASA